MDPRDSQSLIAFNDDLNIEDLLEVIDNRDGRMSKKSDVRAMLDIQNMNQIKDTEIRKQLEKVELIKDDTDYFKLLNKFDEFDLG